MRRAGLGSRSNVACMTEVDPLKNARFDRRTLISRGAAVGAGAAIASSPAQALAGKRNRGRDKVLPNAKIVASRGRPLADLSLAQAASLLRANRISSRELTEACLQRIEERDGEVNAWIRVYTERALAEADGADERLQRREGDGKPRSLIVGAPVGLKDIYAVRGELLTASSKILAGQRASADSRAWSRLNRAGAVLVGHTETHEFAAGNFTPQCSNPWDLSRTPGGSSAGSAIALSARMVPAATGSDTFGSLRIPATFLGLTTIKPTRGLVGTGGVIPLAESLDTAGPIARSAVDAALLLSYMAPRESKLYARRPKGGSKPLAGARIGIPDQTFGGLEPDPPIAARVENFASELQSLGAKLVPFTAPRSEAENLSSPDGFDFFLTTPGSEVNEYHSRYYPQRAAEYTPDVAFFLSLLRAANTPPRDRVEGQRILDELRQNWLDAFSAARLTAVLQPAALIDPPKKERSQIQTQTIGDPMVVWNYTGFPVVGLPAGLNGDSGLPVGVQLIGLPDSDRELLGIGIDAQQRFPHQNPYPPRFC